MSVTLVNKGKQSIFYQFCRSEGSARRQSMTIGQIRILKPGEKAVETAPTGKTDFRIGFSFGLTYTPLVSKPLLSVAYEPDMVCTPASTIAQLPYDEYGGPVASYSVVIGPSNNPSKPSITVISGPKIAGSTKPIIGIRTTRVNSARYGHTTNFKSHKIPYHSLY